MKVELRYVAGCPNVHHAEKLLEGLADEFGFELIRRRVRSRHEAERLGFRGSPSVLIDGRDPFTWDDEPVGLSCRVFRTSDGLRGVPTLDQLRSVLAGDAGPNHQPESQER